MDSNYFAHYLAHQAEHPIRLHQSQQLCDATQAADPQPKRRIALPVRTWMSAALIAAGERKRHHSRQPLPTTVKRMP